MLGNGAFAIPIYTYCQQKVGNSIINRVMDLPIKLVDLPIKHPSTYLIFHPLDREHF